MAPLSPQAGPGGGRGRVLPARERKKARIRLEAGPFAFLPGVCGLHAGDLRPLGLGVELDAVVLLIVVEDAAHEDAEGLGTALVKNLVAGLVKVLGDLVR